MDRKKKKSQNNYKLPAIFILAIFAMATACNPTPGQDVDKTPEQNIPLNQGESTIITTEGSPPQPEETSSQFSILLSAGQAHPQELEPIQQVTGEPLTASEVNLILSRLPGVAPEPDDTVEFNLPEEILPPPRSGDLLDETFPSSIDEEAQVSEPVGPLEVLRYSPEGDIPIAPFMNVTFSQPMVPLNTIADLAAEDVPVIIQPSLSGTWRWLGTKTLNFQYHSDLIDRMPMATEYQVTIPAGTTSAVGGVLEESLQFTFNTPPPTIQNNYPSRDSQPLDPIFFIAFDQRIDPSEVLKTVEVDAAGKAVDIRMASASEVETDKDINRMAENAGDSRWLAFRATKNLPADTAISIKVGPGTPSAEGPLLTQNTQSYNFHTYAPLQIVKHGCSWYENECRPLVPFYIEFNNPIDIDSYKPNMLQIDPELPGATVDIFGNTVQIRGVTKGQTTYKVTVSGQIRDIFGQALGTNQILKFKVGSADPVLTGPDNAIVTLDPESKKPVLSLYTINYNKLDLKVYAVEPADWQAFKEYLREYQQTDQAENPPGKLVIDKTQRIESPTDTLTEVGIDLSEVIDGSSGHFIVIAKPPKGLFQEDRYWETVQVWVQVTQLGLDAFVDHSDMVVWATDLKNGAPLENITIESHSGKALGTTGANGLARFEIPSDGIAYLVARNGDDTTFLPPSSYFWGDENWSPRTVNDELRWYVYDDRQMYRPGEEVHIKGWLREVGGKQDGDVGLVGSGLEAVSYQVYDPQGNNLGGDRIKVNALGGFDFRFTLPENTNLGYASLELSAEGSLGSLDGRWYGHNFQIQEFRRPEFEVTARNETTGPYFADGSATVAVEAKYYAGGPLPNAEVTWWVTASPTNYAPPNWPDFTFGSWQPWWWYSFEDFGESVSNTYSGFTDATGNHYLDLDFENPEGMRPFSVMAEATVMDVNRQAWSGATTLLVHPGAYYVGLRSDSYFVERGTPIKVDLVVTDLDGVPVLDRPIQAKAIRLDWKYVEGSWKEIEVDPQECLVGSGSDPVTCSFETLLGGRYRITAVVTDDMGRKNKSSFTRWVTGGQQPPARKVEMETVTLIPDKENYQPGDTARILVQSPFSPAEGLLTVSRSGILYTHRFEIQEGSATLEVSIEKAHIPNLNIQVDLVGAAQRANDAGELQPDLPTRPAFASGTLTLNIPPLERTLHLDIDPRAAELEPGGETTIAVTLSDSNGEPVPNAELAVVVVDEAILALTNYQITDPISVFYQTRPAFMNAYYSRASIVLTDPLALAEAAQDANQMNEQRAVEKEAGGVVAESLMMEAPAGDFAAAMPEESGQAGSAPIQVRSDFNPLATFAPEVRTDANGEARVEVKLPDNLTRYRVMIVAVDEGGSRFGSGETNLTARLPLMVRPSAPRFLNFGDTFELPVVLQNQTDEPMSVDVVAQSTNLRLTGEVGLRLTIPANDRVEVRFPAATIKAGTARFQIAAVSGSYADAASGELPVYTPATTEAFATYGVVDDGTVIQPVGAPSDIFSEFGGLEIQTSSTALQALTDAVLYLVSYPFECSEQLSSRILGVAALRDVLTAFEAEGLPSPEEMESSVSRDVERLQGMQNWDGGFPYWRHGQESIPFNTIHAAHALQMATRKGYQVPTEMQQLVLTYLREIESHYPHWYSKPTRQTLSAYALYVRDLMGDTDLDKARNLLNEASPENLPIQAVGWIWSVLVDDPNSRAELEAIRKYVGNRVVEAAGAANFTTSYDDQTYLLLNSDRRTDAILLNAMIVDDPESDLIPKLVNGLLAHREKGRWYNTQENVFVLLVLDRYFNTFETQTPDFVAKIWLGETYAGEHEYTGRTTERHETAIPMAYLLDPALGGGGTQNLVIDKVGPGRLYYRLGLRYAPTDLWLDPLDMGFVVQREYEALDDPGDVYRDDEGIWHIKAGARVRIHLTMVADNRRYHVALVDPLPAGLEIVNPALAVSGSLPQDPSSEDYRYGWWWSYPWYQHQNMRDERAEAFTALLWDGVYEYTYIARATTPGTFVVPPAKAEEMYSPEVFGRSASDWVIVE
ncbi:MAG: MG2 domain-containing protein [Anaerolineales bacterium]|nr:MG2 domain-containing protein [Anaerolineales bacterium]